MILRPHGCCRWAGWHCPGMWGVEVWGLWQLLLWWEAGHRKVDGRVKSLGFRAHLPTPMCMSTTFLRCASRISRCTSNSAHNHSTHSHSHSIHEHILSLHAHAQVFDVGSRDALRQLKGHKPHIKMRKLHIHPPTRPPFPRPTPRSLTSAAVTSSGSSRGTSGRRTSRALRPTACTCCRGRTT